MKTIFRHVTSFFFFFFLPSFLTTFVPFFFFYSLLFFFIFLFCLILFPHSEFSLLFSWFSFPPSISFSVSCILYSEQLYTPYLSIYTLSHSVNITFGISTRIGWDKIWHQFLFYFCGCKSQKLYLLYFRNIALVWIVVLSY